MAETGLDFWFEFASTYSYPAAARIEERAREAGVRLRWRPFLLGPIFRAQGWNDSPFNIYPAKGRYMWRDLERICDGHGLRFRRPTQFPRNGLLAARVACAGADQPWLPAFVRGVYHANFADDRDIAQPETLADVLTGLGVLAADVLARAQSDDVKQRLRAETDRAAVLGVFGAPTFVAGEELFWGNDRLEDALAWCRR
jgi:2-hydroxychromene-2-carboxylate isomerase